MPRAAFPSGRKFLLIALTAVIIGGAWWQAQSPPEPVHDGDRLSEFLASRLEGGDMGLRAEELHSFGPGTIPWLTYTAEHGKHPFKRHGPLPFDRTPNWLRRWLPEKWGGLRPSSVTDERIHALEALSVLESEAAIAIPTLARVLERHSEGNDVEPAFWAAFALNSIGPASWPVVEQTLEHGHPKAQSRLLFSIFQRVGTVEKPASQTEVTNAITILDKASTDPDRDVRLFAINGINTCCEHRPDLLRVDSVIDVVIRCLSDSDEAVRRQAVKIIARSGAKGARAIPRLIEQLDAWSPFERKDAAQALGKCDTITKLSAAPLRVMVRDDPEPSCRQEAKTTLILLGLSQDDQGTSVGTVPGR